jgi:hypothetical protein
MGVAFFRVILSFALFLLILSVPLLFVVDPDAPGYVPAVLAAGINALTAVGAALALRHAHRSEKRRRKQRRDSWPGHRTQPSEEGKKPDR